MSRARTVAEGYVHLELTLPDGEDRLDHARWTTLRRVDDDTWSLRFDGPYQGGHLSAEVPVDRAAHAAAEAAGVQYGLGRSTLVDAGQWYLVERSFAGMAEVGSAELAADPADAETWQVVRRAWLDAADAADQIDAFLPRDADEAPADAFWTEHGRRVRDRRPSAFTRDRVRADRDAYRRRAAGMGEPPADARAVPPEVDVPAVVPRPRPASHRAPLPARSYPEAYAYMDAHPCGCGSPRFPRAVVEIPYSDARSFVARYAGACDDCGSAREFGFVLPQRPGVPPEGSHRFAWAGDGPSELLDAGDWIGLAEVHRAFAETVLEPSPADPDRRSAAAELLRTALAGLDEALRFLPPDSPALPSSASWTATGLEVRSLAPERFTRDRLTEERARIAARLAAVAAG